MVDKECPHITISINFGGLVISHCYSPLRNPDFDERIKCSSNDYLSCLYVDKKFKILGVPKNDKI